jgi:ubiquinone/menaquinone biosynthesis C-methylase UbiE
MDSSSVRCSNNACRYSRSPFPSVSGAPALFDFDRGLTSAETFLATLGSSPTPRGVSQSRLRRQLGSLLSQRNYTAERNIPRFLDLLRIDPSSPDRPVVLVIGGGVVGAGVQDLYDAADIDTLAFDIYQTPLVQFMADAHSIPLADGSVDGVLVQAVLEHVLEPQVVVQQIHRVLRSGGIVYADTPFLQQVHDGPYDFTRFTESGHRYLFRDFDRIDSGTVAGPGTQLMWSIDYFFRALFRSRTIGLLMRLAFSWLARVDRFLGAKYAIDGASSVFFLGRKGESRISIEEIVAHYQGTTWQG